MTGWQVGDEVCALLTGGGYAQKVAVPAGQLLPVPEGIGLVEAAGLPEAVATVWSDIVTTGGLKKGENLLVHGGAGGVGTAAIQIAKALGARVVTTVGGPEKVARVRELGADVAVDHRTEDFAEFGPYDVILDVVGGDYLERNVRSLAADGEERLADDRERRRAPARPPDRSHGRGHRGPPAHGDGRPPRQDPAGERLKGR